MDRTLARGGRLAAAAAFLALRPASAASASDCASLGQAANFVAFSNGDFNASPPGGENITGRIAAARRCDAGRPRERRRVRERGNRRRLPNRGGRGQLHRRHEHGAGGSVNGGVRYGGTSSVASNFYINGGTQHGDPPFSFSDEFASLRTLSASLADLDQTGGASVHANPNGALELTGTDTGLNVFTVSAAQLTQARAS